MRRKAPLTKLQKKAASLTSGVLKEQLQRYVNSAGAATRNYEETANPVALDVIVENAETMIVLAQELLSRSKSGDGFFPTPDPHLEELTQKFLQQTRNVQVPQF